MARSFTANGQRLTGSAPFTAMPWTIAGWINPDDITGNHTLAGMGVITGTNSWQRAAAFGAATGDPAVATTVLNTTARTANSVSGYSASSWSHIAAVFASTTSRKVSLNGATLVSNTTSSTVTTPTTISIGQCFQTLWAYQLFGKACHVAIWNVELTQEEINSLANKWCPCLIRPSALKGYWPLLSNDSDMSPTNTILSVTGSPSFVESVSIKSLLLG